MYFQAILPHFHNFFRYDSAPAFNRVDQKRHSLSSLSRYQVPSLAPSSGGGGSGNGSAASLSSRNSYQRRSAIIPRNNRRSMQMSAIKEHQRKFEIYSKLFVMLIFHNSRRFNHLFVYFDAVFSSKDSEWLENLEQFRIRLQFDTFSGNFLK